MQDLQVGFIGAGNMAKAIIGGLIASGHSPDNLWASCRSQKKLTQLNQETGIHTCTDNTTIIEQCTVVVLAVKPHQIASVCSEIQAMAEKKQTLIISIAAAITCQKLTDWLYPSVKCVRCMPNTPSLIKQGVSGLYANAEASADDKKLAEHLMQAVGITEWVNKESLLDAITALSGCGPAYFFLMMEAMQVAGEQLGLTAETARKLTLQTAQGAAQMAQASASSSAELRQQVTSKGGCTAKAIDVFEKAQLRDTVMSAMQAAAVRSLTLAKEIG